MEFYENELRNALLEFAPGSQEVHLGHVAHALHEDVSTSEESLPRTSIVDAPLNHKTARPQSG